MSQKQSWHNLKVLCFELLNLKIEDAAFSTFQVENKIS